MLFQKKLFGVVLCVLSFSCFSQSAGPYAAESAIYRVEVPHKNSTSVGFGAGVLIAGDKILTNCHVVKDHPGWPRVVHRQTGQMFSVSEYYNLGDLDACVLVGRFAGIPVRIAEGFQENENVWIFGFPHGISVVGQGAVKGLVDTDRGRSILLAAFCAPGSSGGPVVNVKGELVGLNWGVFRYQNQCLSVPGALLLGRLSGG